jgi:hypothetical protein
MALREIEFEDAADAPLPADVEEFIAEAERRIDGFLSSSKGVGLPGFVPSDFRQVYRALRAMVLDHLPTGELFCEWGSGFGVVAGLARFLGLDASGIEFNNDLVDEAEALMDDFGLEVEFARGTFVPPGGGHYLDQAGEFDWLFSGGVCGYESLGLDPADFDVIFAFPWPGEEDIITGLFNRYAAEGALLVTSHSGEAVRIRRKFSKHRGQV